MGLFQYTSRTFSRELMLMVVAAAFTLPAYLLLTLSVKTTAETYVAPLKFPTNPKFSTYPTAWREGGMSGLDRAMINNLILTVGSVICLIVIGSFCAYVLARRPSRLSTALYFLFVLGIILPFQLAIIPLFVLYVNLGLAGTYLGMILLYTGQLMPFTVFLYAGFIRALPKDYEEAAQIDGAGLLRMYVRVVFPLLRPVTGTVAVLTGLITWNEFFIPLVFLFGTNKETLPIALFSFVGENAQEWNLIMAAVTISITPILGFYLVAQRQLIQGFSGGIRG